MSPLPPACLALDLGSTMGFAAARDLVVTPVRPLDAASYSCWPEKLLTKRKGERPGMRPKRLRDALVSVITSMRAGEFFDEPREPVLVYEDIVFQKGHLAAIVFGQLLGVILETCETLGVSYSGISPSTYRAYVFGHTNPTEHETLYVVSSLLGEHWSGETDHNAADAMALLLWKIATSTNEETGTVPGLIAPARWCAASVWRRGLRKKLKAASHQV